MSDKHLREKAVNSDTKMRSTPIGELCFRVYHNWNLLRTSTLAEVRWCREITRENGAGYSIGVKYL